MIPALYALHVLAHPFNHARPLMTQHHCLAGFVPVVAEVYIGMADARGDEAHQDFVVPRTFQFEGFDLQGAAFLAQDGRLNSGCFDVGRMIHGNFLVRAHLQGEDLALSRLRPFRRLHQTAGSGPILTSILPKFSPLNREMKAFGAFSIPATIVSFHLIRPSAIH